MNKTLFTGVLAILLTEETADGVEFFGFGRKIKEIQAF
jgi:hypothetical protein